MKKNKKKILENLFYIICVLIIVACIIIIFITKDKKDVDIGADFLEPKLDGESKTIESGELTKYMQDTENEIYVKTAITKIDGNVAYSLTYAYDLIPERDVVTENYFTAGTMAAILLNGYPNKTYEEMGLNSEEEAYIATQLAVYDFANSIQFDDMIEEEFSMDNIIASDSQYEDMVTRVKTKAEELLEYAKENPFEENLSAIMNVDDAKISTNGEYTIAGPYSATTDTDNNTKRIMGEKFNPTIEINAKSYFPNTNAIISDKDGNELKEVSNGQEFYIKINGIEKAFSQFKLSGKTYVLRARIYKNNENKKQYVVLEPKEIEYSDIISIINNLDTGKFNVNFKDDEGEEISGVKYYIYDENDQFIQDIDSNGIYDFDLPVGKYYIKLYEIPDGYFINGEKFEFEITKNNESVIDILVEHL